MLKKMSENFKLVLSSKLRVIYSNILVLKLTKKRIILNKNHFFIKSANVQLVILNIVEIRLMSNHIFSNVQVHK